LFSLTRKSEYALVALARLAEARADDDEPDAVSARQIADRYDLPAALLMNVLKALQRAEIVRSVRGARGGYTLTRGLDEVTLGEVIEAIEGPLAIVPCACEDEQARQEAQDACRIAPNCPVTRSMQTVQQKLERFVHGITLEDLFGEEAATRREADDAAVGPIARIGIE
jgi:Rrf2 family protein